MLPRHTSIADTIIPMVFYAEPFQVRLRYVLKRELLIDPCLDIVGNRLPNLFVDRSGQDSERARQGVAALVANLAPDEGVLIYPEGTRFSRARHQALMSRYADAPAMLAQLARWPDLLPPRLGGTMALLAANPGRDLVFCAHTGFEGSSHFSTLVNGAWRGARVRIHFWRVPFADVPSDRDSQVAFIQAQWDRMQAWITAQGAARRNAPART
jgi:1-acyl-sn-glycerol-3-phosphate acyltransferase